MKKIKKIKPLILIQGNVSYPFVCFFSTSIQSLTIGGILKIKIPTNYMNIFLAPELGKATTANPT